jgi:hypothetical protein
MYHPAGSTPSSAPLSAPSSADSTRPQLYDRPRLPPNIQPAQRRFTQARKLPPVDFTVPPSSRAVQFSQKHAHVQQRLPSQTKPRALACKGASAGENAGGESHPG